MTAHAAIMDYQMEDGVSSSWQLPSAEIDKLLHLSYKLPLTDEITPVQMWQRLCSLTSFETWDTAQLRYLQAELLSEVRCYGFGAVVDESVFERILNTVSLSSSVPP